VSHGGKGQVWAGVRSGAALILIGLTLAGCNTRAPTPENSAAADSSSDNQQSGGGPLDPRLHQPFQTAVLQEPPNEDQRLPETTMTGKSVGRLYTEVVRLWNEIRFTNPAGKRLIYRATLETELGPIELALLPDIAPNHVRNFVALARAGYYDGLVFERTVHEESDDGSGAKVDLVEAGCPMGTGDGGFGSLGYWLKPEFNTDAHHEEGTLGACHGEDPDTACGKFYITLGKAPVMDGSFTVFGKVTRGLDVVRRIFTQPVRNDPEFPEGDRPEKPIVIRKVTVRVTDDE